MQCVGQRAARATLVAGLAIAAVLPAPGTAQTPPPAIPAGWHAVMPVVGDYTVRGEVARRTGGDGWMCATIASAVEKPRYALFQQSIRADLYRGQRVRLTGYLKTSSSEGAAGLFVRVDGERGAEASDYMIGRLVNEPRDWAPYSVVVDVPKDAVGITFGFHLTGNGQAWLDDLTFETVGLDVATTAVPGHQVLKALGGFTVAQAGTNGSAGRGPEIDQRRRQAYASALLSPYNLDFERVATVAARR